MGDEEKEEVTYMIEEGKRRFEIGKCEATVSRLEVLRA